jgi:hypothetical protein
VAQRAENLLGKQDTLSSNSSTIKKKKNNKDQNEVYIKILYTNIEITVSNKVHIEHIF